MSSGREQDRPQTVPSEKREAAVERPKPLWLCGLGGGRWRTRTSYLVRVKQIRTWTARDYTGLSQKSWTWQDPRGLVGTHNRPQTVPRIDAVISYR